MSGTLAMGLYSQSVKSVDVDSSGKRVLISSPQLDQPALAGTGRPVTSALSRSKDPEPKLCIELRSAISDRFSSSSTGSDSFPGREVTFHPTSNFYCLMDGWMDG